MNSTKSTLDEEISRLKFELNSETTQKEMRPSLGEGIDEELVPVYYPDTERRQKAITSIQKTLENLDRKDPEYKKLISVLQQTITNNKDWIIQEEAKSLYFRFEPPINKFIRKAVAAGVIGGGIYAWYCLIAK